MHYFNDFLEAKTYLYIAHWKCGRYMTFMDLVSDRTLETIAGKWGQWPYTASENMAADQGHHVLQHYMNITANAQQLLDMEDLFVTSANLTVGI